MQIVPGDLDETAAYRLLIASVIPRPVAWCSTVDPDGRPNLAPFSFFNAVTSDPPTLVVGIGKSSPDRRPSGRKDTAENLLATREAVVHIAPRRLAAEMVATSASLPPGESEFAFAGLAAEPSVDVRPPRIAGAPIAMECVLDRHLEVGNDPSDVFLLRVVRFHVDDAVLRDGLPDARLVDAVGRLGGESYCGTADVFAVPRPRRRA